MEKQLKELLTHPEIILNSDWNLLTRSVYACGISNNTESSGSTIPKPKYGKSCRTIPCTEWSFCLRPCSTEILCCSAFQFFSYRHRPVDMTPTQIIQADLETLSETIIIIMFTLAQVVVGQHKQYLLQMKPNKNTQGDGIPLYGRLINIEMFII